MCNNHWHIIIFDMLNCVSRITKIKMCYMAIIASYLATYTVNLLKQNQNFYVDLYKMWDAASSLPHTKTPIEHTTTVFKYRLNTSDFLPITARSSENLSMLCLHIT